MNTWEINRMDAEELVSRVQAPEWDPNTLRSLKNAGRAIETFLKSLPADQIPA